MSKKSYYNTLDFNLTKICVFFQRTIH